MTDGIKTFLSAEGISDLSSARARLDEELRLLQKAGVLTLESDEKLLGFSLELRVQRAFESAGFSISEGRPGMEDFVVESRTDFEPKDNVVLEVKGSRKSQPTLDDLRQLDDWVFDLSGEEKARKVGLGGGIDPMAIATRGLASRAKRHLAPHKGVLVFNGPVGIPFSERPKDILHPNQLEFAAKRNFCVIGLGQLLQVLDSGPENAWKAFHSTVGEYQSGA